MINKKVESAIQGPNNGGGGGNGGAGAAIGGGKNINPQGKGNANNNIGNKMIEMNILDKNGKKKE